MDEEANQGNEGEGGESVPSSEAIEKKAKGMGWIPKERFNGREDEFIPADEFVRRGEEMIPILRANNRKLEGELAEVRANAARNETLLRASQESIEELKNFNSSIAKERAEGRKKELLKGISEAKRAGDVEAETELQDQLQEHNNAMKAAGEPPGEKKPPGGSPPPDPNAWRKDPTMQAWMRDNEWFGRDEAMTAYSSAVAARLKADPANSDVKGRTFLDMVSEEVVRRFDDGQRGRSSKVEGGRGSGEGGGAGSGKKSYSDLPADVKVVCERQGKKVVGEGRAFKTQDEWRKHYTKMYFQE